MYWYIKCHHAFSQVILLLDYYLEIIWSGCVPSLLETTMFSYVSISWKQLCVSNHFSFQKTHKQWLQSFPTFLKYLKPKYWHFSSSVFYNFSLQIHLCWKYETALLVHFTGDKQYYCSWTSLNAFNFPKRYKSQCNTEVSNVCTYSLVQRNV